MLTFRLALQGEREIDVNVIKAMIGRARKVICAPEIDRVQALLNEAHSMFDKGRLDYAMGLGQAAFEAANGLFNAVAVEKPVRIGHKLLRASTTSNAGKTKLARDQTAKWQQEADTIWSNPQHVKKSASAVAQIICRDGGNHGTVRKAIKKKKLA